MEYYWCRNGGEGTLGGDRFWAVILWNTTGAEMGGKGTLGDSGR